MRVIDERKPNVRTHHGRASAVVLIVVMAACSSSASPKDPPVSGQTSATPVVSASTSEPAAAFPIEAFADVSYDAVSDETAAAFQAALNDMAGRGGMAATVMSPDGTWSGAAGKADGVRDVRVHDQFGIASVTKSVVSAQVMQLVEAGELELTDPAADYLPPNIDFDTNGATIRQLLDMHAGIPDFYDARMKERIATDRDRSWTPADSRALVDTDRTPAGDEFLYTDTNYVLLGLVVEQIRGRSLVDVLRDGVLSVDGIERLVYQPDEAPTEPMAMPNGESTAALEKGGGYLPSLSDASSGGPAGAIASDSPSLAGWWRAFCAGEIVSQASLAEMSTFDDGYGLGLYNIADPYANAVGHTGENFGFVAWAGCLPEDGAIVVVLSNRIVEDIGGMAEPLVDAVG